MVAESVSFFYSLLHDMFLTHHLVEPLLFHMDPMFAIPQISLTSYSPKEDLAAKANPLAAAAYNVIPEEETATEEKVILPEIAKMTPIKG